MREEIQAKRALENGDRDQLIANQKNRFHSLYKQLGNNNFYQQKWEYPSSLPHLNDLPFTLKTELCEDQEEHYPYGSNLSYAHSTYVRLHQTSGTSGKPMTWIDTRESWDWFITCWLLIFEAAGITDQDRFLFPFSFGPFVGFWGGFEGAQHRGCFVIAGGGMSSKARIEMMLKHKITSVCCTPTYAQRLAQTAQDLGLPLGESPVKNLILAGEPGAAVPGVRQRIEEGWQARVFDHYGMTEMGPVTIECVHAPGQPHVLETEFIAEILDSSTGEAVSEGEYGELVLTNLGRAGSPLIRYKTGDMVRATTEPCACGRRTMRLLGGILGRRDDMIFVKGNNVYPSQIEELLRQFNEVDEFCIHLHEEQGLTQIAIDLELTAQQTHDERQIADSVSKRFHDRFHFRVRVSIVPTGSLPRFEMKAKRIKDHRT